MSKAKEAISDLRAKYFENKKQEAVKDAEEKIKESLDLTCFDVIQDPESKKRKFLLVTIKYDLVSKKAVVEDISELQDKVLGLTIVMDKENRKYLFEKYRSKK